MTRIGPEAAARTCCKARRDAKAMRRTRTAMCAACNGNRPACPRDGLQVKLHIQGQPCPREWHPDARNRVRWARLSWAGAPFPIRLYLLLRKPDADPDTWVDSFAGCGCVRAIKAAWLRLARRSRVRG